MQMEDTDKLPKGKKPCLSLRELEKQVNTDLDLLVNIVDGQMTVCELVDRYLRTSRRIEKGKARNRDMLQYRDYLQRKRLAKRQSEA